MFNRLVGTYVLTPNRMYDCLAFRILSLGTLEERNANAKVQFTVVELLR